MPQRRQKISLFFLSSRDLDIFFLANTEPTIQNPCGHNKFATFDNANAMLRHVQISPTLAEHSTVMTKRQNFCVLAKTELTLCTQVFRDPDLNMYS